MKSKLFSCLVGLFVLTLTMSFITPNNARRGSFTIKNDSDWTITEIYFGLEDGSVEWGEDYLSGTIAPGGSFKFYNIPTGSYGVMVKDDSGDTCIHREIDIDAGQEWSWGFDNTACGDE